MNTKQIFGSLFVLIILNATFLSVLGIWGVIEGEAVWQMIITLFVLAVGLGVSGRIISMFFKDN
jgi:hypothetical protein